MHKKRRTDKGEGSITLTGAMSEPIGIRETV
jgi:hypothetical protein